MTFIPLATDDAATARKKLERFLQVYQQEQEAMGVTYGKDQGYTPNPLTTNPGYTPKRRSTDAPGATPTAAPGGTQPAPTNRNIRVKF
jgi:hypothetical protein